MDKFTSLVWTKKIIVMDNAHDPYATEIYAMGGNIHVDNVDT